MEEIRFRDVVRFVWKSKWWVACATALAVGIGVMMYANATPRYQITMALVPARSNQNPWEQGSQVAGTLASQFLGVPVGDRSIQKAQQFLSLFRSPAVLERADKKLGLLPHLFYGSWDPDRKDWIEPTGWPTRLRTMLRSDLPWVPPSLADAAKTLERTITVSSLFGGTLVEISFVDRDPTFGVALLDTLYGESDELLRERARIQNDEHIDYIQKALATVSYAETRQSLTTLLTAEVGQRVMINSNSPYAMEVLKPPYPNPRPVSPSLTFHMLIALAAGLVLGIGASAVATALRGDRLPSRPRTLTPVSGKSPLPHQA